MEKTHQITGERESKRTKGGQRDENDAGSKRKKKREGAEVAASRVFHSASIKKNKIKQTRTCSDVHNGAIVQP